MAGRPSHLVHVIQNANTEQETHSPLAVTGAHEDGTHLSELDIFNAKYRNSMDDAIGSSARSDTRAMIRRKRRELASLKDQELDFLSRPRKVANPGPIGLLGFGMTTILLNLHNTGHWPLYSVVPAMGICFGGGSQFIAGLLEWCRGNTFAYVAFTSYGAFWLSLVCVWMLPNASSGGPLGVGATPQYYLGVYLLIWGIYSFAMMLCTIRMNLALFLVFFTVTLLFLLLGGGNMAGSATTLKVAGYEGIVCGSLALYLAIAEVLNEVWDRTLLPVVPMSDLLALFTGAREEDVEGEKKDG